MSGKVTEEIREALRRAEARMTEDFRSALPSRDVQWKRISKLAGLDGEGGILPPRIGKNAPR
jgi:hypothetical protein